MTGWSRGAHCLGNINILMNVLWWLPIFKERQCPGVRRPRKRDQGPTECERIRAGNAGFRLRELGKGPAWPGQSEEEPMTQRIPTHGLSRREVLSAARAGLLAVAGIGLVAQSAAADQAAVLGAIKKLVGDNTPREGRVALRMPGLAVNGEFVALTVEVESPMTASDHVKAVHVFAEDNPWPDVASFHFTPRSGKAIVVTRMRLAKTQSVIAVAEMSDGSVYMTKARVKVVFGACGG